MKQIIFLIFSLMAFAYGEAIKETKTVTVEQEISLNALVLESISKHKKEVQKMSPIGFAHDKYKTAADILIFKKYGGIAGLQYRIDSLVNSFSSRPIEMYNNMKLPKKFIYRTGDSVDNFVDEGLVTAQGSFPDYLKRMNRFGCYVTSNALKVGEKLKNKKPTLEEVKKEIDLIIGRDFFDFLTSAKLLDIDMMYKAPDEREAEKCSVLNDSPITVGNESESSGSSSSYGGSVGSSTGTSSSYSLNLHGFVGQKVMCQDGKGIDYEGNTIKIYGEDCYATIGQGVKIWCSTGTIFDTESEKMCNRKISIKISDSKNSESLIF